MSKESRDKKSLYKLYKKELKKYNSWMVVAPDLCLDYFIIFLKYLRDMRIMDSQTLDLSEDNYVATISAAIQSYSSAVNCIHNYYNVTEFSVTRKDENLSAEEVQQKYAEEKTKYFDAFWEIVKTNLGTWLA